MITTLTPTPETHPRRPPGPGSLQPGARLA